MSPLPLRRQVHDLGALLPVLAAAGEGIGSADADYRRSDDPLPDLQADTVDTVKVLPCLSLACCSDHPVALPCYHFEIVASSLAYELRTAH